MLREPREHLDSLRIDLPSLREPVENLSGGQRPAVAVARAVAWGQRVVIMDEPTAALGVTETEMVLDLIRAVKQRGVPVIVISHDLPEVFQVADRIQVLRLGQPAGIAHPGRDAPDDVVRMMAGLDAA
jgi:ABC-type sugar transport system ATPase subunit